MNILFNFSWRLKVLVACIIVLFGSQGWCRMTPWSAGHMAHERQDTFVRCTLTAHEKSQSPLHSAIDNSLAHINREAIVRREWRRRLSANNCPLLHSPVVLCNTGQRFSPAEVTASHISTETAKSAPTFHFIWYSTVTLVQSDQTRATQYGTSLVPGKYV